MQTPSSILLIGRDVQFQQLRTMILQNAGYQVTAAVSDAEALRLIDAPNSFTLVLLCHSVPEPSRVAIVARIKQLNSKLPVLMLYNGYDPTDAKVDGSLHNLESPQVWLEMIHFLTQKSAFHPV